MLGRGPDNYDCWGLVWRVYKDVYGFDLPGFLEIDATSRLSIARAFVKNAVSYQLHDSAVHGCTVLTGKGRINHCGIYLSDSDSLLHVTEGATSRVESLATLRQKGFSTWKFYTPYDP